MPYPLRLSSASFIDFHGIGADERRPMCSEVENMQVLSAIGVIVKGEEKG
jgi:hypothetical protein